MLDCDRYTGFSIFKSVSNGFFQYLINSPHLRIFFFAFYNCLMLLFYFCNWDRSRVYDAKVAIFIHVWSPSLESLLECHLLWVWPTCSRKVGLFRRFKCVPMILLDLWMCVRHLSLDSCIIHWVNRFIIVFKYIKSISKTIGNLCPNVYLTICSVWFLQL